MCLYLSLQSSTRLTGTESNGLVLVSSKEREDELQVSGAGDDDDLVRSISKWLQDRDMFFFFNLSTLRSCNLAIHDLLRFSRSQPASSRDRLTDAKYAFVAFLVLDYLAKHTVLRMF